MITNTHEEARWKQRKCSFDGCLRDVMVVLPGQDTTSLPPLLRKAALEPSPRPEFNLCQEHYLGLVASAGWPWPTERVNTRTHHKPSDAAAKTAGKTKLMAVSG